MKSLSLFAAVAAFALAPTTAGQADFGAKLKPAALDFWFEEQEDGSILTADAKGTYYFANWSAYVQSPFFQEHGLHCGTDRLAHPLAFGAPSDCNASNTNPAAEYDPQGGADYVIPVVFHILRRTNGVGEVSDALIQSQMNVLNEDFGAFGNGAPGTNTRIQFTLAGVTRSNNNNWYNDGGTYYNSLAWDTTQYLNIYTNTAGGNLGYAYVPSGGGVVGNTWDRVVLYWPAVGRPAPYGAPYHLGRSATHEVGHYLGLYHTFDGGCTSPSGCYTNGDLICDTNPESSPNISPCSRTTCGSPDPTANYMDYSDDVCMNNFTSDQAHRMRCTLANFRVDLGDTGGPTPPGAATGPSPANGASSVSVTADLAWSAGSGADSHDVYFGTDSTPDAGEFLGNQSGTSFDPGTLANSTTYYWRIDEVNTAGTTTGTVWSFTTESGGGGSPPGQASSPSPSNGATNLNRNTNLSWSAGSGATQHAVYFGTDSTPDASEFQGNQTGATYDPGTLARGTTYYRRIDESNANGTTVGVVWTFSPR
jgi:hypothetical protein